MVTGDEEELYLKAHFFAGGRLCANKVNALENI
jgi:hypothetical protein